MELKPTGHQLDRMRERGITAADIEVALANQVSSWRTPKNSTCITGKVGKRLLAIYIVEELPCDVATIKTVAWKGE